MLCGSQAAAFYPTLCANDYVPDSYRLAGTVEAGLRKCRFRRSSGLPSSPTSVGDERGSTAHLWSASHRPHLDALITLHWLRAQERVLFKMAVLMYKASHGAARLYLSQLVRVGDLPGRRCLRSARTNLGAVRETVYRWRPGLPSRQTYHLEQPAEQRDLCSVSFNIPSASENIHLPGLVF